MEKRRAALTDPSGKRVYHDPNYVPTAGEKKKNLHVVPTGWSAPRVEKDEQVQNIPPEHSMAWRLSMCNTGSGPVDTDRIPSNAFVPMEQTGRDNPVTVVQPTSSLIRTGVIKQEPSRPTRKKSGGMLGTLSGGFSRF